jgi:hypothetical protein
MSPKVSSLCLLPALQCARRPITHPAAIAMEDREPSQPVMLQISATLSSTRMETTMGLSSREEIALVKDAACADVICLTVGNSKDLLGRSSMMVDEF